MMPRKQAAKRKAKWVAKQRWDDAQRMRDESFREEMERLAKPPVTPEWVEKINERHRNVIGGDRALKGRPMLTAKDRGVNKRVHNQRDKEGRTFRKTESEREYAHYAGDSRWNRHDFTDPGDASHHGIYGGFDAPLTEEQRETMLGQNRYRRHAEDMRERTGPVVNATHGARHTHLGTCYSDTCRTSPNDPVTSAGRGVKAPEAPVNGRWTTI
jgi:hypothetical protein